jgi:hypothetical protein
MALCVSEDHTNDILVERDVTRDGIGSGRRTVFRSVPVTFHLESQVVNDIGVIKMRARIDTGSGEASHIVRTRRSQLTHRNPSFKMPHG